MEGHYSLLNSGHIPPQLSEWHFRRAATIRSRLNTRLEPDLSEGTQAWRLPSLTPKARHKPLGKHIASMATDVLPLFLFLPSRQQEKAPHARETRGGTQPSHPFRAQQPPNAVPLLKICPSCSCSPRQTSSSCSTNSFIYHPYPLSSWKGLQSCCHPGRTGSSCCGVWGCLQELSPAQVSTVPAWHGQFRWQH